MAFKIFYIFFSFKSNTPKKTEYYLVNFLLLCIFVNTYLNKFLYILITKLVFWTHQINEAKIFNLSFEVFCEIFIYIF